jgi:RNA polymerase sigma-70 factor, ECF subfamily
MSKQQNFRDCIAEQVPFLTRTVRRLMHGDQMAEDIVQETVLKALTHADQFRFESTLKTWLVSIAVNEIRQAYRRCKWCKHTVPLMEETVDMDRCRSLTFSNNDYEANERATFVRNAVCGLPDMYRSVLELCDFQQLEMKDAARKLGLTLATVKTRRHRARQRLRPLMAQLQSKPANAFV